MSASAGAESASNAEPPNPRYETVMTVGLADRGSPDHEEPVFDTRREKVALPRL